MPKLFDSKVPSGDLGAATEDSGAVVGDGVAGDGDDSPQPVRKHVVAKQTAAQVNPFRITISLRNVGQM